ncbi:MAG: hypothetical protein J5I53_06750 [Bradyrhizobiaceae bacterium]|nr:hypothetical protein [Bradyrhizobiaceae bacterium]
MIIPAAVRTWHIAFLITLCWLVLPACNEAPTEVGSDLIQGTDTLYANASGSTPLLDSLHTISAYPVMYNPTYFLFGKTDDAEGRLFLELLDYPALGDSTKWEVVECALGLRPQPYLYGDTLNTTVGLRGYDLQKLWETQITWDSVWTSDGSTSYYTETTDRVMDTTLTVATTDTLVYAPFSKSAARRWMVIGADSARRVNELHGMVILPTNTSSIRQFRNAEQNTQIMMVRLITKHADSTEPDTTFLKTAVASFVNTAPAAPSQLVVQGARIHSVQFKAQLDSLPAYAVVVGASLSVHVNPTASVVGSGGVDEVLELSYTSASGRVLRYDMRRSDATTFVFTNISAIAQQIQLDGGHGTLELRPSSAYNTWKMNRLVLEGADSTPDLAPRFTVVYTIPTVFK